MGTRYKQTRSSYMLDQKSQTCGSWGNMENTAYIDSDSVRDELRFARLVIEKGGFTLINVTNKPIETSANEIIGIISDRFGHPDRSVNEPEA
jgi:[pyruvate, water dikinase]-phosphate phosphotransferase / [pyruvate, water dikinase] kinase